MNCSKIWEMMSSPVKSSVKQLIVHRAGSFNMLTFAMAHPLSDQMEALTENSATVSVETSTLAATKTVDQLFNFKGACSYTGMRHFIFNNAYPDARTANPGVWKNPRCLIERDGNLNGDKIHIEATSIAPLFEFPDMKGTRVVSVKEVLGIIYNDANGTRICWREPGRLWGCAPQSIIDLLCRKGENESNATIATTKTGGQGHPA